MKKAISAILAAAFCFGSAGVFAEEQKDISVYVDDRRVSYPESAPIIRDDSVLIPLRSALEAMDAKVGWNGETREVTVDSYDYRTRVILEIDSTAVRKFYYKSITEAVRTDIESPTAPVIVGERTMVPLRVISEALGADVDWDPDTRTVTVESAQYKEAKEEENYESSKPGLYLSCDAEEVKEGDTVTVKVELSNAEAVRDFFYAGGSLTVCYDSELYSYKGYTLTSDGEAVEPFAASDNGAFLNDSVKIAYLFYPEKTAPITDGVIAELKFKALSDKAGAFTLSDRVTNLGYDCTLTATKGYSAYVFEKAYEIDIDTNPLTIGEK